MRPPRDATRGHDKRVEDAGTVALKVRNDSKPVVRKIKHDSFFAMCFFCFCCFLLPSFFFKLVNEVYSKSIQRFSTFPGEFSAFRSPLSSLAKNVKLRSGFQSGLGGFVGLALFEVISYFPSV